MVAAIKKIIKKIITISPIAFTQNERYDQLSQQIIKIVCTPESSCIDVGANQGKILKMMLNAAPHGIHFAFEPIPKLFNLLNQNFGNKVNIFCLALSDKKESTSFNLVLTDMAYSGLKKRAYDKKERDTSIEVATNLLDEIITTTTKISLMKIDVEGAELLVLRGAIKTIQQSKPLLLFEFGKAGASAYHYNDKDMFTFFTQTLQYNIYTLKNWLKNKPAYTQEKFSTNFNFGKEYFFVGEAK